MWILLVLLSVSPEGKNTPDWYRHYITLTLLPPAGHLYQTHSVVTFMCKVLGAQKQLQTCRKVTNYSNGRWSVEVNKTKWCFWRWRSLRKGFTQRSTTWALSFNIDTCFCITPRYSISLPASLLFLMLLPAAPSPFPAPPLSGFLVHRAIFPTFPF